MEKKRNWEKNIIGTFSILGDPSIYLFDKEIYPLSNEELRELEEETGYLIEEAEDKISSLENIINELSRLIDQGKNKKRYVRACLYLGRENIDVIRYFDKVFNQKARISTIIAPPGYWAAGDELKTIKEIAEDKNYYENCMAWLNHFIDIIKENKLELTDELSVVANEYILPLLETKKSEFEEAIKF